MGNKTKKTASAKKTAKTRGSAKKAPVKKQRGATASRAAKKKTSSTRKPAAKVTSGGSRVEDKIAGFFDGISEFAKGRRSEADTDTEFVWPTIESQFGSLLEGITELTGSAFKVASKTREAAVDARKKVSAAGMKTAAVVKHSPEQLRKMADAGEKLRDLREVADMTLTDLSSALKIKDRSFLRKVEDGKEALSLEVILRLASLYARNDPLPFVFKHIRTYRPQLWETLEEWGLDSLPIKLERERNFVNIYRSNDAARQLSTEGFEKLLELTTQVFNIGLHFIAEQEGIVLAKDDAEESEPEKPAK